MRPRTIIGAFVVIFIVASACYYFYGYRSQAISANFNAMVDSTSGTATTTAVKTALALNNNVASFDIHVETSNNDVTLTGQVPTVEDKRIAEEVARSTKGVANVVNNLQVDPKMLAATAAKQYVTDLEIKTAVLESILNNPDLKTQQLKVEVSNGEIKLSGSVQTAAQKTAAEAAARAITNVRKVESQALAVTQVTNELR
ncbi:MAG: BON domain-containing protein [Acidobacteria bacterium]|nr:BON domain-containing protein [Acidobacteriota bacterium]MBI3428154.1 BON domain-containing protein [Acidobacteriota bacterium]